MANCISCTLHYYTMKVTKEHALYYCTGASHMTVKKLSIGIAFKIHLVEFYFLVLSKNTERVSITIILLFR